MISLTVSTLVPIRMTALEACEDAIGDLRRDDTMQLKQMTVDGQSRLFIYDKADRLCGVLPEGDQMLARVKESGRYTAYVERVIKGPGPGSKRFRAVIFMIGSPAGILDVP